MNNSLTWAGSLKLKIIQGSRLHGFGPTPTSSGYFLPNFPNLEDPIWRLSLPSSGLSWKPKPRPAPMEEEDPCKQILAVLKSHRLANLLCPLQDQRQTIFLPDFPEWDALGNTNTRNGLNKTITKPRRPRRVRDIEDGHKGFPHARPGLSDFDSLRRSGANRTRLGLGRSHTKEGRDAHSQKGDLQVFHITFWLGFHVRCIGYISSSVLGPNLDTGAEATSVLLALKTSGAPGRMVLRCWSKMLSFYSFSCPGGLISNMGCPLDWGALAWIGS